MKTRLLLAAAAGILSLSGCMKFETYPVNAASNGCKIASMHVFNGSMPVDTARFTWSGNNITRVRLNAYSYDIEYDGTLPVKRNFFMPGATTPYRYDRLVYNPAANYLLTRYELFEESVPGSFYRSDSTVYRFAGGFMAGMDQWIRFTASDTMELMRRADFTYTGPNLSKVREIFYGATVDTTVTTITTNADPNPVKAIHNWFWFIGPVWDQDAYQGVQFSLSRDAQATISGGTLPILLGYFYDDQRNLTEYKENNQVVARYFYNCP